MKKAFAKMQDNIENFLVWIWKHPVRAAILVLFVVLSIYLKVHEANTGLGDEFPGSDPWAYSINAQKFVDTGVFPTTPFNPLQILYLGVVYFVFGVHQYVARLIQILFSFVLAYFLFRITKKYFGKEAGFIAALLALIEPNIVYYSAHLWDMFWVIFFLTLAIYLFVVSLDREKVPRRTYFLIGLVGAIGSLGKLWVGAAAIVLIVFLVLNENKYKFNFALITKHYLKVLLFFAGLLIIILPWNMYVSSLAGFPVMINSNSNLNFYLGNNPRGSIAMESIYDYSYANSTVIEEGTCADLMYNDSDPKEPYYLSKCLGKYTRNYIAENPGRFVKKLYLFTTEYWLYPNLEWYQRNVRTPHLRLFVMWALFVLAMIGFLVSLQKFKGFFPFYLVILGIWFSFAITVFLGRYKSSVAPFTVLFAAGGLYTALFVLGVYGKGKKDGKRGWEEKKDREDKAGREERRGRTEIKANKENEKRKKPQKKEIQKKEPKEGPPQENDGTKAAPEEAPKETSPVQEAQGAGEKKPEDREEQDHEAPPRESLKEVFGEDATAESLEKSAGEEKK